MAVTPSAADCGFGCTPTDSMWWTGHDCLRVASSSNYAWWAKGCGEGGLEPLLLPAEMASELQVHSESFPLSPARYLRFRSRALTASRAVTNFHARTAGQRVSNREAPEVRPCASWWCLLQH
jgi:hypothetical protein